MKYTISCFCLLFCIGASAQCPPPGYPVPGNTCALAPIFCQNLDGFCSTLSDNNVQQPFPGCAGNWILNNDEWIGFFAASHSISIQITPGNCTGSGANIGMQGGIYQECVAGVMDVQCTCTEDPFILSANNFEIGKVYWLMLDGCAGDICDYSIKVTQGATGPCADIINVCGDSCLTICDSIFCEEGVHIATCTDSIGNLSSYPFYLDRHLANASIAPSPAGSITCSAPQLSLFALNSAGDLAWFDDAGQALGSSPWITIQTPGFYTLKATDGPCVDTDKILVKDNRQLPQVSATGGTLDASHPTVQLMGHSINSGVTYAWVGPGAFSSNLKNPTVQFPGTYTLTVTIPNTGCSNTTEVIVNQN